MCSWESPWSSPEHSFKSQGWETEKLLSKFPASLYSEGSEASMVDSQGDAGFPPC